MSFENPEPQNKSKEVSFFETSDPVVENLVDKNPEYGSILRKNLSELGISSLKEANNENIDKAIEKRLDKEVNKIGKGHNFDVVNKLKNEILNDINKIDNKEEKLKAYCDFLEGLKDDVGTTIKSQYIQNKDYQKNQQREQSQNKENQSFLEKGNKLRKEIDFQITELRKNNKAEYNKGSSEDCVKTLKENYNFNYKYEIKDSLLDLIRNNGEAVVYYNHGVGNNKQIEVGKINFQESTFNPNGGSQKTKFHNADSLQKAIEKTMENNR